MDTVEELSFYYNLIIWGFVLLAGVFGFERNKSNILTVFLIIALSILVGTRDVYSTVDTVNYWKNFNGIAALTDYSSFLDRYSVLEEPLMYSVFFVAANIGSFNLALWIVSITTLTLVYLFCVNFSRYAEIKNPFLLFVAYLISFYIQSQQYHIMRAGLAMAFVLNFYYYLMRGRRTQCIVFALLAVATHISVLIPLTAALGVKLVKVKDKVYYLIFVSAIVISYLGFGLHSIGFLNSLEIDKVQHYLSNQDEDRYITGFRLSFVVFNTLFLILFNTLNKHRDSIFEFLFHLYIILSVILFLSFSIPFFDRIGAFSWNIIPLLTYYVIVKRHPSNPKFYGFITIVFLYLIKVSIGLIS